MTRTRKKRMRKKRTGSRVLPCIVFLLAAAASGGDKRALKPHGVVAGTVFREPGFALPGARVVLTSLPEPGSALKPFKEAALSSPRGEFAFAVDPVEMHYKVAVSAKGFAPQEKKVEIRGEEQVEATFMLQEQSK
jgi:hypothetical protein